MAFSQLTQKQQGKKYACKMPYPAMSTVSKDPLTLLSTNKLKQMKNTVDTLLGAAEKGRD